MTTITYYDALNQLDGQVSPLARDERFRLQQRWRELFAPGVKARTGKWQHNGTDWHAFSFGFCYALSGAKASDAYTREATASVLIIPGDNHLPAVRYRGESLPEFAGLRVDVYVWAESGEWSMVFTHEDDFGPYYTRA